MTEQQAQQLTPAEREAMTAAWDAEGNLRPWHFLSFDLAQAAERVFVAGRAAALGAVAASPDEHGLLNPIGSPYVCRCGEAFASRDVLNAHVDAAAGCLPEDEKPA